MKTLFITIAALFFSHCLSAQQHADCDSAFYVCSKNFYEFLQCRGEGNNTKEADYVPCFMTSLSLGKAEHNSTWLKFKVKKGGKIMFEIDPLDSDDDFDFALFRMDDNGLCKDIMPAVRCMAAGGKDAKCNCCGKTGLREKEKDESENGGCGQQNNNYLAPLSVKPDQWYALLVSNMTSTKGFLITFSGTAKLQCDD